MMFTFLNIRRHPDSNWGIKALQASALPLGHAAIHNQNREISGRRDSDPRHSAWKADALPAELLPQGTKFSLPLYTIPNILFSQYFIYYFSIKSLLLPNKSITKHQ